MTDNRTTELQRLLDERGVEWECGKTLPDYTIWKDAGGREYDAWVSFYGEGTLLVGGLTPEQAIAATLGSERETCHGESDLSEWVCSNCQCWIPLGLTPDNIKYASEWLYCPHCGAKVQP